MYRFSIGMVLVTMLAGCGGEAESREDLEGQATERAGQTQPARAVPPPPVRAIPAGTVLTFEVRENVSTSSHVAGDAFSLVLVDGVTGSGGAALGSGTQARGLVTDIHKSTGPNDDAILGVQVVSIDAGGVQRSIEGQVQSAAIESDNRDSGARTAATIATGAAAGAIIGQILGRDTRSTVTGAAVGTAVGVGVALSTRGGDATLPQGSRIVVRLDRDLVL
jgi:hypothetical protein